MIFLVLAVAIAGFVGVFDFWHAIGFTVAMPFEISIPQLVGVLAATLSLSSFLLRVDSHMKFAAMVGALVWAWHYHLLGASSAAVVCVVISLRQLSVIVSHVYSSRLKMLLSLFWTLVFFVVMVVTWEGYSSILPFVATTNATIAMVFMSGARMRSQVLLSDASWLVYNAVWLSIGGFVTSLLAIAINLKTILSLRKSV